MKINYLKTFMLSLFSGIFTMVGAQNASQVPNR